MKASVSSLMNIASSAYLPILPESAAFPVVGTAAESVVDLLVNMGLDTFFGLPGGPIVTFFDAILQHKKATLVEPRHEAYGTFEAMGFYRASGKVPVVVITSGPGATNAITGIVNAHLERVPMLVVIGDVPWSSTGHRMFQNTGAEGVGIERMLTGITRVIVRIPHSDSASSQVRAAVQAAMDPHNPGPAAVVLSIDHASATVVPPRLYAPQAGAGPMGGHAPPDPSLIGSTMRRLRGAQRPLVWIGAGCRRDAVKVRELVDALGAPFVTTPQAKGIVPEDHPLSLRTCGFGAAWGARRYTKAGPDVALVLGSDLDDLSTAGTPPIGKDGVLIHVDTDGSVFTRNFPTAIGAMHDIGSFCDAMLDVVGRKVLRKDGLQLVSEAKEGSVYDAPDYDTDAQVPIAPHRVIADLERAAGPSATFVSDIGEHMLFCLHYLNTTAERRFVVHLGLGSMGSGISSAVGLALGDPSRRVICVCGDGGMQMAGMEILVAIKHKLPIVYAIFNDARYNMVYHGYRQICGHEAGFDTPHIDFALWARALGAKGHRIERPGEINRFLLNALLADGGPVVLDIRQNPDIRIKGDGRIEAIRHMSMQEAPHAGG